MIDIVRSARFCGDFVSVGIMDIRGVVVDSVLFVLVLRAKRVDVAPARWSSP